MAEDRTKGTKGKRNKIATAITIVVLIIASFVLDKAGVWDVALARLNGVSSAGTSNGIETLNVYFTDVGQGDCTLFVNDTYSMLVDCGEAEYADVVIKEINSFDIETLTYIVVTHAHSDHMGGMAQIIEEIGAQYIIISEPSQSSAEGTMYENFLDAAESSGAQIIISEPEYTFSIGNLKCEILAPFNVSSSNENNNSIVMYCTFGSTSFLMTGDAETEVEKQIIKAYPDLRADILKIGHHGSKTSTSEDFLKLISPDTAVISVGAGNSYGHPTSEILNRLYEYNVGYYRTDTSGTITITCTLDTYNVTTEK